ncbi:hypothetical protein GNI_125690 [Gregarina niphandrodes]|uniref:Uncharacterized protein n=1 Tax=Gregarina niphandrodes TaxID=110365 RepID=A0A023B2K9_GRENI|nr:hypothetical protein GNI_125690 [Gregarina niphandrodes]EZG50578.1 hypothetical protein GNI_125690 [Gregarina niphandrodes]|eukprot:XP_011132007.1 hypothetical protein GNI_125690 [Gregarina niphandrodes]
MDLAGDDNDILDSILLADRSGVKTCEALAAALRRLFTGSVLESSVVDMHPFPAPFVSEQLASVPGAMKTRKRKKCPGKVVFDVLEGLNARVPDVPLKTVARAVAFAASRLARRTHARDDRNFVLELHHLQRALLALHHSVFWVANTLERNNQPGARQRRMNRAEFERRTDLTLARIVAPPEEDRRPGEVPPGEIAPGAGEVAPGAGEVAPGAGEVAPGAGEVAPGAREGGPDPPSPGPPSPGETEPREGEELRAGNPTAIPVESAPFEQLEAGGGDEEMTEEEGESGAAGESEVSSREVGDPSDDAMVHDLLMGLSQAVGGAPSKVESPSKVEPAGKVEPARSVEYDKHGLRCCRILSCLVHCMIGIVNTLAAFHADGNEPTDIALIALRTLIDTWEVAEKCVPGGLLYTIELQRLANERKTFEKKTADKGAGKAAEKGKVAVQQGMAKGVVEPKGTAEPKLIQACSLNPLADFWWLRCGFSKPSSIVPVADTTYNGPFVPAGGSAVDAVETQFANTSSTLTDLGFKPALYLSFVKHFLDDLVLPTGVSPGNPSGGSSGSLPAGQGAMGQRALGQRAMEYDVDKILRSDRILQLIKYSINVVLAMRLPQLDESWLIRCTDHGRWDLKYLCVILLNRCFKFDRWSLDAQRKLEMPTQGLIWDRSAYVRDAVAKTLITLSYQLPYKDGAFKRFAPLLHSPWRPFRESGVALISKCRAINLVALSQAIRILISNAIAKVPPSGEGPALRTSSPSGRSTRSPFKSTTRPQVHNASAPNGSGPNGPASSGSDTVIYTSLESWMEAASDIAVTNRHLTSECRTAVTEFWSRSFEKGPKGPAFLVFCAFALSVFERQFDEMLPTIPIPILEKYDLLQNLFPRRFTKTLIVLPPTEKPRSVKLAFSPRGEPIQPVGPQTLGPETLGPETLGPETLGPETLGPEDSCDPESLVPESLGQETLGQETLGQDATDGLVQNFLKDNFGIDARPAGIGQAGGESAVQPGEDEPMFGEEVNSADEAENPPSDSDQLLLSETDRAPCSSQPDSSNPNSVVTPGAATPASIDISDSEEGSEQQEMSAERQPIGKLYTPGPLPVCLYAHCQRVVSPVLLLRWRSLDDLPGEIVKDYKLGNPAYVGLPVQNMTEATPESIPCLVICVNKRLTPTCARRRPTFTTSFLESQLKEAAPDVWAFMFNATNLNYFNLVIEGATPGSVLEDKNSNMVATVSSHFKQSFHMAVQQTGWNVLILRPPSTAVSRRGA